METDLTLEDVDPGGAIAEAVDELTGERAPTSSARR